MNSNNAHWEKVYQTKNFDSVSWYTSHLKSSLSIISKLNTGAQILFMMLTLTAAAFHWPSFELLTMLGAIVIFTSITSGLNYVIDWSRRAWLKTHLR